MCYCTITYKCSHTEEHVKPYHCKCDDFALENKRFVSSCDDCMVGRPCNNSMRVEGMRFENEEIPETRARLAQIIANRADEEEDEQESPGASEAVELGVRGPEGGKNEKHPTKHELVGERSDGEERQQAEKELGLGSWVAEKPTKE